MRIALTWLTLLGNSWCFEDTCLTQLTLEAAVRKDLLVVSAKTEFRIHSHSYSPGMTENNMVLVVPFILRLYMYKNVPLGVNDIPCSWTRLLCDCFFDLLEFRDIWPFVKNLMYKLVFLNILAGISFVLSILNNGTFFIVSINTDQDASCTSVGCPVFWILFCTTVPDGVLHLTSFNISWLKLSLAEVWPDFWKIKSYFWNYKIAFEVVWIILQNVLCIIRRASRENLPEIILLGNSSRSSRSKSCKKWGEILIYAIFDALVDLSRFAGDLFLQLL